LALSISTQAAPVEPKKTFGMLGIFDFSVPASASSFAATFSQTSISLLKNDKTGGS